MPEVATALLNFPSLFKRPTLVRASLDPSLALLWGTRLTSLRLPRLRPGKFVRGGKVLSELRP